MSAPPPAVVAPAEPRGGLEPVAPEKAPPASFTPVTAQEGPGGATSPLTTTLDGVDDHLGTGAAGGVAAPNGPDPSTQPAPAGDAPPSTGTAAPPNGTAAPDATADAQPAASDGSADGGTPPPGH